MIQWQSLEHPLLETLDLHVSEPAITANASLQGELDGAPLDLRYQLLLAPDWTWREFHLLAGDAPPFRLLNGAAGHTAPFLDFVLTPFTNTLPIRRLNLNVGEAAVIDVLYVDYPATSPTVQQQEYTRLDAGHYRFRQLSTGFEAVIAVDEAGLVTDYPELFRRLA